MAVGDDVRRLDGSRRSEVRPSKALAPPHSNVRRTPRPSSKPSSTRVNKHFANPHPWTGNRSTMGIAARHSPGVASVPPMIPTSARLTAKASFLMRERWTLCRSPDDPSRPSRKVVNLSRRQSWRRHPGASVRLAPFDPRTGMIRPIRNWRGAADRLRDYAHRDLSHLTHMPSTSTFAAGDWHACGGRREKAVAADEVFRKTRQDPGLLLDPDGAQQSHAGICRRHAGPKRKATTAIDQMIANYITNDIRTKYPAMVDGFLAMPYELDCGSAAGSDAGAAAAGRSSIHLPRPCGTSPAESPFREEESPRPKPRRPPSLPRGPPFHRARHSAIRRLRPCWAWLTPCWPARFFIGKAKWTNRSRC